MPQQIVTNFTVVDENHRGRQLGFRSYYESDSTPYIELRYDGSNVAQMTQDDFKKLLLAGEKLADLLAIEETNDDQATPETAS